MQTGKFRFYGNPFENRAYTACLFIYYLFYCAGIRECACVRFETLGVILNGHLETIFLVKRDVWIYMYNIVQHRPTMRLFTVGHSRLSGYKLAIIHCKMCLAMWRGRS